MLGVLLCSFLTLPGELAIGHKMVDVSMTFVHVFFGECHQKENLRVLDDKTSVPDRRTKNETKFRRYCFA